MNSSSIARSARFSGSGFRALALALLLWILHPVRSSAEDRIEYRYEDYKEENNRIHIRTHAVGFEKELSSRIVAKGTLVYDGISGATPTGELPAAGTEELPVVEIEDIRRAFSFDLGFKYGRHTTTPQMSYSVESDYVSKGLALTHTIDFNQKNTTLVLGYSRNFDSVGGGVLDAFRRKDANDFLVGVNQLLGPTTVLTVNAGVSYSDGYLDDPYRRTMFLLPDSPDPIFSDPASVNPLSENRPRHRFKQTGYLSLTQGIKPLNASVEGSYRIQNDDWGILSHTTSLTWNQKIGRFLTLSPMFRYYRQGAADFYAPSFRGVSFEQYASGTRIAFQDGVFVAFEDEPGFPVPADQAAFQIVNVGARPAYYSSDFRLSELETLTFGIGAQIRIKEHFTIDLAFKRYEMSGLDSVTRGQAYPSANVFTVGCGFWF